jgi:ribosomal protein S18 acetylase RimI-like enzyme
MIIREANNSDLTAIANIHIESWQDSYSEVFPPEVMNGEIIPSLKEHWQNIAIQNDDVVLVAADKDIIGFIAVWCRPIPFIDNLHVKPSHRSINVGTLLMESAAEALIMKGKRSGYLWVFNSNESAIRFYKKLGGVQTDYSMKDFFGHKVSSQKLEWGDLSAIVRKKNINYQ